MAVTAVCRHPGCVHGKRVMTPLVGAMAVLVLVGSPLRAQDPKRVFNRPAVPPATVLDRLNLRMAWRAYVPTDGTRDGIFSIQVLEDMIVVQLRSGLIVALNA